MLTFTGVQERVERGAKWLDNHDPEWFTHIELDTLDMEYSDDCVLGQLTGDYNAAVYMWPDNVSLSSHGFDIADDEETRVGDPRWAVLTQCWVTEILNRRFEAEHGRTPETVPSLVSA